MLRFFFNKYRTTIIYCYFILFYLGVEKKKMPFLVTAIFNWKKKHIWSFLMVLIFGKKRTFLFIFHKWSEGTTVSALRWWLSYGRARLAGFLLRRGLFALWWRQKKAATLFRLYLVVDRGFVDSRTSGHVRLDCGAAVSPMVSSTLR